jgi:hypothetical protein
MATFTRPLRRKYAQSGASGTVKAFAVNEDGSLSPIGSWTVPDGGSQEGIAAAQPNAPALPSPKGRGIKAQTPGSPFPGAAGLLRAAIR